MTSVRGVAECQLLCYILQHKDYSIINKYDIQEKHFNTDIFDENNNFSFNTKDVYKFITNHINRYNIVPDIATLLSTYPSFDVIEVNESIEHLTDTIKEEYNCEQYCKVIDNANKLMQNNSYDAVNYLKNELLKLNENSNRNIGIDLIHCAQDRLDAYNEKRANQSRTYITTGFKELDDIIGGFNREGELAFIQARTGQSKTFMLLKIGYEAWMKGERIALYEPEMTAQEIGYRLDSLIGRFSNFNLLRGKELDGDYEEYIKSLKEKNAPFIFVSQKDFNYHTTVSKLKDFCMNNNINELLLDGITNDYIIDETSDRNTRSDIKIANIARDLLNMSKELKMPIISVLQSRRVSKNDDLGLDTVGESYQLTHQATLMLSIKKVEKNITITIDKNRNGISDGKLKYLVDLDKGVWAYDDSDDTTTLSSGIHNKRNKNKSNKSNEDDVGDNF